jgi:hypothetical protein
VLQYLICQSCITSNYVVNVVRKQPAGEHMCRLCIIICLCLFLYEHPVA